MASIAQLVSEFAHTLGEPNNVGLKNHIKLIVAQTRNELIRRSYENHGYVDKGLTQRYKVSLTTINDGEVELPEGYDDDITKIKRTLQQVPRPVRLTNNLPFDRVSSVGFKTNREFPFIKETSARFRSAVPGLCAMPCYDYINGFIYLFPSNNKPIMIDKIIIESAFEHPTEIEINNGLVDPISVLDESNEWLIPEDMIGQIKEIIMKRGLLSNNHRTNEIPNDVKFNQ